jgi:outer membrane murein-binding lipoprotein Lpp
MRRTSRLTVLAIVVATLIGTGCSSSSTSKGDGFCTTYGKLNSASNTAGSDLTSLKKQYATEAQELKSAVANAPSEIKPQVQKVQQAFERINARIQAAGNTSDVSSAVNDLSSDSDLTVAGRAIASYTNQHCKGTSS